MQYDWLNLWKASRVKKKLHEQHGPNGAGSGWPATGARYCGKIVTGIPGGKLSTAKEIQFLQAPVTCFVCELFSVFRQLRSEFWHHCLFLSLQFTLIVELLFSNMHPSITIYFNSPIHTFLCIIPSGGFTDILHRPTSSPKTYWRCVRVKITSR